MNPRAILVANGAVIPILTVAGIGFYVGNEIWMYGYFMVSPVLPEEIIVGMNFFKFYKATTDCSRQCITFQLTSGAEVKIQGEKQKSYHHNMNICKPDLSPFYEDGLFPTAHHLQP